MKSLRFNKSQSKISVTFRWEVTDYAVKGDVSNQCAWLYEMCNKYEIYVPGM